MLVFQAQSARTSLLTSDFTAAKLWVEMNSEPGTWKQSSVDSWIYNGNGGQMGIVYAVQLETGSESDPLRVLAFRILAGDPMALDAARDILKC